MRVLLISLNFAPEPTGIGKASGELAAALVDAGHEVEVICAPPHYPGWRVARGHSAWRWRRESPRPGLTVQRCPVWVPRRPGGAARLLHLASFALTLLPPLAAVALRRPAVVFVVAPALFAAPAAWAAARLTGAAAWLHVQDLEVDAAFALGVLRSATLRRIALAGERAILRAFDRVSSLSSAMLDRLAAKGVEAGRLVLLPNGVDTRSVFPLPGASPLRAELGLADGQVVCLFAGTMNRKQGLDVVIGAAERLRGDTHIRFVLCGDGECRAELERSAASAPNLQLLELQPAERLNVLLNLADIHLLPQRADAADLVMPSKLAGMLASGRPVVAAVAAGTEVADVVAGCGLVVPAGDAGALAAAIAALAGDAAGRRRAGAAARAYAEAALDTALLQRRLDAALVAAAEGRGLPAPVAGTGGTAG